MFRDPFLKLTLKQVCLILALIVGCRVTRCYLIIPVMLMGLYYAFSNQRGKALIFYMLVPFLSIINPMVLPKTSVFSAPTRIGMMLMTIGLFLAANRSVGKQRLPFGWLFAFVLCAILSSAQGYFPMISYFKIINYVFFILGIYYGTKNINHRPGDVELVRANFFAFSIIIIAGSIATLPFPSIAYYVTARHVISKAGVAAAEEFLQYRDQNLFCGITIHSQFLAPMLSCIAGWLICDMLYIEKKFEKIHLALIAVIPPMLYATRSRIGFFSFGVMLIMVYFYCMPRIRLRSDIKGRINVGFICLLFMIVAAMGIAQVRDQSISKWLRKTNDIVDDQRSLTEALTSSRQGAIEANMRDFRRAPLLGTGFQVIERHRQLYDAGYISLFSAPIEKGILPLMVLGETGVLGASVFAVFLIVFYFSCVQHRYYATLSLFTVLLSTNMAESTFFSPSGGGGIYWMMTVVGGFIVDMMVGRMRQA